jgi:hypothetical protein
VGTGYSLLFAGGLGVLTAAAPAHHRASLISSAYVVGYFAQAVAALGLGALATSGGLELSLEVGGVAIGLIGVGALLAARLGTLTFREEAGPRRMVATDTASSRL